MSSLESRSQSRGTQEEGDRQRERQRERQRDPQRERERRHCRGRGAGRPVRGAERARARSKTRQVGWASTVGGSTWMPVSLSPLSIAAEWPRTELTELTEPGDVLVIFGLVLRIHPLVLLHRGQPKRVIDVPLVGMQRGTRTEGRRGSGLGRGGRGWGGAGGVGL